MDAMRQILSAELENVSEAVPVGLSSTKYEVKHQESNTRQDPASKSCYKGCIPEIPKEFRQT